MDTTSTCLAVGFRRCELGHRLMNKRGYCVQCNPTLLMRTRQWIGDGYVYLAESASTKLVKLGSCGNLQQRQKTLNERTYAGADDWRIRLYHYTVAAEMFEWDVHRRLRRFQTRIGFSEYSRDKEATEVYRCAYRTAKRHLELAIEETASHYAEISWQCLEA